MWRGLASWLLLACLAAAGAYAQPTVTLEGPHYAIEVDAVHGRILRLADRAGVCALTVPADVAENFRLLLEIGGGKRVLLTGAQQPLSGVSRVGDTLELAWDGPLSDGEGNRYDIAVRLTAAADGEAVVFDCGVENRSAATVVEVWYPLLGGLGDLATPEQRSQTALYPPPAQKTLALPFGEYAMGYPAQLNVGFMDLDNAAANRGLYMGLHDKVARFKRFQFTELGKGNETSIAACVVHYPFVKTGETFHGSPMVFRFHDGDWRAGARFYRDWFVETFGLMTPSRDWIRRESFFQMIMMMLPEGNINYTFDQVPRLARDGLKYGVRSLQLAGWQRGGHDNGYPYYEPDPRLGTWDDVARAIRKCHDMGVKVYFFANFQPVMMDIAWYREELEDYVTRNAYGAPSWIAGWGMGTLASRMGDTVPLMAFADVSFPGMSDALTGYFRQLAEAGADGLHIDKMFPSPLDFNPRLNMKPDTSPWEGAVQLMARIDRECRAVNEDFRMSFECNWDRALEFGCATWWAGNMSTAKMVFPEVAETVGHYMPYDFLGLNRAVRLGYAIMIAPYKFNRSMDFAPWRRMARYIREVKRIRDDAADIVYLGEALPPQQALFQKESLPGGVQFTAWRSLKDGRRGCIFTNDTMSPVDLRMLGFDGKTAGPIELHVPFERKVATVFPAEVQIPAEGLAFVVEK